MVEFIIENQWIIWLVLLWTIPWKGVALWKAARNSHKAWFIILLVFNTFAILEIFYVFIFSRKGEEDYREENYSRGNNKNGNGTNLIRGL